MRSLNFLIMVLFITSNAFGSISYKYKLNPNEVSVLEVNEGQEITFPEAVQVFEYGKPSIPAASIRLIVPNSFNPLNIDISSTQQSLLNGIYNLSDNYGLYFDREAVVHTKELQSVDIPECFYPDKIVEISSVGILMGAKVVEIIIYPVQYNLVNGQVSVYSEISFTIAGNYVIDNTPTRHTSAKVARKTSNLLRSIIDNPNDFKNCYREPSIFSTDEISVLACERQKTPNRDQPAQADLVYDYFEYLIVTDEDFVEAFTPLRNSKNDRGLRAKIVTLQQIRELIGGLGDDAEAIRKYLARSWRLSGLQWVLLGGDVEVIPTRMIRTKLDHRWAATDMYYACIDGEWNTNKNAVIGDWTGRSAGSDHMDLHPELWVGRAPVRNVAEVDTFVSKILQYQSNFENVDYRNRALLLATDFAVEQDAKNIINFLEDLLPISISTTQLTSYEETLTRSAALQELNSGHSLVFNVSHGNEFRMCCGEDLLTRTDLYELNNENKCGLMVSISCEHGMFNSDCLGEAWIRNGRGGGIGFIGSSTYDYPYLSANSYLRSFENLLSKGKAFSMGEVLTRSKLSYTGFAVRYSPYRTVYMGYNLLGDPEAYIWTDEPHDFKDNFPGAYNAGQFNNANLDIEDDPTNVDVPHVSLSLSVDEDFYYSTFSDKDGVLETGSFFPDSVVTNAKLYVVAPNYEPFTTMIPITEGSNYPSITNYALTDVTGNIENEMVDAGETFLIDVYVYNSNISSFSDISCTISSTSSEVEEITTS
ncbi:MAG: C25 family cysteine peptidase, partial [Candidatus Hatepunaea meridiana]|nr:C25 family cysteine peptidase [Candidatus Hatepunaea meridiana]